MNGKFARAKSVLWCSHCRTHRYVAAPTRPWNDSPGRNALTGGAGGLLPAPLTLHHNHSRRSPLSAATPRQCERVRANTVYSVIQASFAHPLSLDRPESRTIAGGFVRSSICMSSAPHRGNVNTRLSQDALQRNLDLCIPRKGISGWDLA